MANDALIFIQAHAGSKLWWWWPAGHFPGITVKSWGNLTLWCGSGPGIMINKKSELRNFYVLRKLLIHKDTGNITADLDAFLMSSLYFSLLLLLLFFCCLFWFKKGTLFCPWFFFLFQCIFLLILKYTLYVHIYLYFSFYVYCIFPCSTVSIVVQCNPNEITR